MICTIDQIDNNLHNDQIDAGLHNDQIDADQQMLICILIIL